MNKDKHSFENLCGSCKKPCCTSFAAPIAFDTDIIKLKKINKDSDEFLEDVSIAGSKLKKLRKTKGTTNCVFWNKESGCTIYQDRPFDCKMFPFDIEPIDGEYYWIVYTCNLDSDWSWTEQHLIDLEQDPIIKNKTFCDIISHSPITSSEWIDYKILRKVNFPQKNNIITSQ